MFRIQKQDLGPQWVKTNAPGGPSLYVCQNANCLERMQRKRYLQKRWGTIPEQDLHDFFERLKLPGKN